MKSTAEQPSAVNDHTSGRKTRRGKGAGQAVPPMRGLLLLGAALAIWQLTISEQSPYAPPPSQWWSQVSQMWSAGILGKAILATTQTFAISLIVAIGLGVALGTIVGRSRLIDRALGPFLEYCRVMPAAAIVPLVVLFAGYTERMKVIVVVFTAIWPILLQVRAGARSLDPILLDTGKALHLGRLGTARKVLLPSLVPSILLGIRVATPTVLIVVLLVEIVTRVSGLGGLIEESQQNFNSAGVFGLLALIALLALLVNSAVTALEAYLLRYRPHR